MKFKSRYKTLIGLILFSSIYIYVFYFEDPVDHMDFNTAVWKESPAEHSLESIRLRMVEDFLDQYDVVGMSESQIIDLLGSSDNTNYFKDYDLVYCLGQETESYFGIDSQWLVFEIDDLNKINSFQIVTD